MMLEYNLTKLDNDFITLWSKYILTSDASYIMKDLEKLAELGQINAVQSWYLFKEIGDNEKIDSIVQSYTCGNYNELYAMANYASKQEEVLEELRKLYENYDYWYKKYCKYYDSQDYLRQEDEESKSKMKAIKNKIYDVKSLALYWSACKMASNLAGQTNNAIINQRMAEMMYGIIPYIPFKSEKEEWLKAAKKSNIISTKILLKQYQQNLKRDKKIDINTDPSFYYAVGKALVLFDKKAKFKNIGLGILREFSEREYSKELQEEINKDKTKGSTKEDIK